MFDDYLAIASTISDFVIIKLLFALKSFTRTAVRSPEIIFDKSSSGVVMSTNGNASCMIDSIFSCFEFGSCIILLKTGGEPVTAMGALQKVGLIAVGLPEH